VRRESTIAESKPTKDQCRLIVRNMSWKVNSDTLRHSFSQFGPIAHVHIPEKEDGKSRGFGFVQYLCQTDAASAIAGMNGKDVLGRVIAVDWVMAKTIAPKTNAKSEESEGGEDSDDGESGAEEEVDDSDDGESGAESASEGW
jgi:RNA recognition motif-containing protein